MAKFKILFGIPVLDNQLKNGISKDQITMFYGKVNIPKSQMIAEHMVEQKKK